jgi:DnaJ domain
MPHVDDQLAEWKAAYRVLDAPLSASALAIKQNYRKLMKRWHPDHFLSGSPEQTEATLMTRVINDAYARIDRAPLRYYAEVHPSYAEGQGVQQAARSTMESWTDPFPNADRIEFWVRFFFGAAFGVLISLTFLMRSYMRSYIHYGFGLPVDLIISAGIIILFGLGAARGGDKFWHSIFRYWWLWP